MTSDQPVTIDWIIKHIEHIELMYCVERAEKPVTGNVRRPTDTNPHDRSVTQILVSQRRVP